MAVNAGVPMLDWTLWVGPVALVLGGVLLGALLEQLLLRGFRLRLRSEAMETVQESASPLKGAVWGLSILGGLYLATFNLPFVTPQSLQVSRTLLFAAAMLLTIHLVARLLVVLVRFLFRRMPELQALPNTSIFENSIRVVVYLIGGLALLQTLGVSVLPVLTALGVGGLAISLALQDTLANVFAGINMILARQVRVGDYVRLETGDFEGFVEDIGWRSTVIRRWDRHRIVVPNSKLASAILLNLSPAPPFQVILEVQVASGSDLERVEVESKRLAQEVRAECSPPTTVALPEPQARIQRMDVTGIQLSVVLPIPSGTDVGAIRHAFYQQLPARYRAAGIALAVPEQIIRLHAADDQVKCPAGQEENASL